jgi:thioredoxin-related protein
MKPLLICLSLMLAIIQNCGAEVEWLTDLHAAMDKASAENKVILLDFTGSDWCGWCKRLKAEVLDQPEFAAFAKANLVMVEVDFPRNKPQTPEEHEANAALARTYNIRGYPTIVLIDSLAHEVGRTGYRPGGPPAFIAELEKVPGIRHVDATPAVADTREVAPTAHAQPVLLPTAVTIPMHYGELTLKGVSGSKDRRMALINNETLMVGETAKIKVHDARVEVTCNEIRDDSVLITVGGKQQELKLGQH